MDDDLNTADALAAIFDLVRMINTYVCGNDPSAELCSYAAEEFDELTGVLGIVYNRKKEDPLDEKVEKMIADRNEARNNKDYAMADAIRDELKAMGIVIEDTPQGIKWHKE